MVSLDRWNPDQYERFSGERARPFHDLLARVVARDPAYVVDLGCGTGEATGTLLDRWPGARIDGVDVSPDMIDVARSRWRPGRLEFIQADLRTWTPARPVDVLVSNAALQWVPEHLDLLPQLFGWLAPGGWLAFQVPGNYREPSHRILGEMAAEASWAMRLRDSGAGEVRSWEPEDYLAALRAVGARVDVWETTYLHVLAGRDPVFEWIAGTGARPVLRRLEASDREEFEQEYRSRLREAYPRRPYGTVLPFRRIFAVGQTPADRSESPDAH